MSATKKAERRIEELLGVGRYVDISAMIFPVIAGRWPNIAVSPLERMPDHLEGMVFGHRVDGETFYVRVRVPLDPLIGASTMASAERIVRTEIQAAVNSMVREFSHCQCHGSVPCKEHAGTVWEAGEIKVDTNPQQR